jgi:tetratricopeptide (TPR) repeat protein
VPSARTSRNRSRLCGPIRSASSSSEAHCLAFGAWAIFAATLLAAGAVCAAEPTETLEAGNEAYRRGDYAAAAAAYEELRVEGHASADLLYNLGTAYLKGGDLGRAIANYERALLLAPRDPDLQDNLDLARERCVDKAPDRSFALLALASGALRRITPDEWALLFVCSYVLLLATWVVPSFRPATRRWAGVSRLPLALVVAFSLLGLRAWSDQARPRSRAVVIARANTSEVTVRSGPGENYIGEFSLHPGTVVRVIEEREGWLKIAFSPSLRGWAETNGFELL